MARAFAVTAPDLRKVWALPALTLGLALVGVFVAARTDPRAWMVLLPIALATGAIACMLARRGIEIDGDVLRVRAGIHGRSLPLDALDLSSARVVDLDREPDLRPWFKTFGTAMPGFQAGHFRLRNRGRAFVLLTDRRNVLAIAERDGRMLLLSPTHPRTVIDALVAHASRNARRMP